MRWAAAIALVACGGGSSSSDTRDVPLPDRVEAGADATPSTPPPPPDPPPPPSDAGADASGCPGAAGCQRIVFATSTLYVGNVIGGYAGADAKCQAAASASINAGVKNGTFVAWISTQGSAAKARLVHGTKPYVKPSGAKVANDWTDLTKGSLQSGIGEDENGVTVGGEAWTGTTTAGSSGPNECDAWTATGTNGAAGNVGGSGSGWSDGNASV
ncbi:MAG TPA: hypothetical protein VIF62_11195, partial [Labilithrix sp.]